jgi:2'-5' RNA ligase
LKYSGGELDGNQKSYHEPAAEPRKIRNMQTIIQNMPGYRKNDYLLVLAPHEELRNRIVQIKKEIGGTMRTGRISQGKPHLALVKFSQLEMMEERICNRLKIISMAYHPFRVELRDFGSYPSHSIFINVVTRDPVKQLVKELKEGQRLMKSSDDNKPHFIEEPNFLIANRLLPGQYEKAWSVFSHRHFTARFMADHILLLKRREQEKSWQIAQRFDFLNMPVSTRQGQLFV